MAEIEHVKRARVGRPNRLTSSASKREKSENDAKCNRSRKNIGEEFGRWTDLKTRFRLKTRAEVGTILSFTKSGCLVLTHLQRNTSSKLFMCYYWPGLRREIFTFRLRKKSASLFVATWLLAWSEKQYKSYHSKCLVKWDQISASLFSCFRLLNKYFVRNK